MSVNYSVLKDNEAVLLVQFKEFFEETIDFSAFVLGAFIKNDDNVELFEVAIEKDHSINVKRKDLIDECIWSIQKNNPRANHLRFIICLINSLSDIRRISSHAVNFSKFYAKNNSEINDKIRDRIIDLYSLTIQAMKDLHNVIFSLKKEEERKKIIDEIFRNFLKSYKHRYYEIISVKDEIHSDKYLSNLIIFLKNLDRQVDHCLNIAYNFLAI